MAFKNKDDANEYARNYRARNLDRVGSYVKESRRRRRSQLDDWKKGKPCLDCGVVFPVECMDFDHRPGTIKLFQIGQSHVSHIWEDVLKEIEKCDLICANCHRIRTKRRIQRTK